MRSDPRYLEAWESRPELADLARLRLEALEAGEMAGIHPDGTVVRLEGSPLVRE